MTTEKHLPTFEVEISQPLTTDQIYTLTSATKLLECSERTLADKVRAGEIPAKKKLGRWYFTHSSLLAYVNS